MTQAPRAHLRATRAHADAGPVDNDQGATQLALADLVGESPQRRSRFLHSRWPDAKPDDAKVIANWKRATVREILIEGDHRGAVFLGPSVNGAVRRHRKAHICRVSHVPARPKGPEPFEDGVRDVLIQQHNKRLSHAR